jgi:hypothetical protein
LTRARSLLVCWLGLMLLLWPWPVLMPSTSIASWISTVSWATVGALPSPLPVHSMPGVPAILSVLVVLLSPLLTGLLVLIRRCAGRER